MEPLHEDQRINHLIKLGSMHEILDTNNISDGYHTFGELYAHRIVLFITLCRVLANNINFHSPAIWRTRAHSDGTYLKGWFLMGINKEHGKQITYHIPEGYWTKCDFAETLTAAPFYDEHTSDDVLKRLSEL